MPSRTSERDLQPYPGAPAGGTQAGALSAPEGYAQALDQGELEAGGPSEITEMAELVAQLGESAGVATPSRAKKKVVKKKSGGSRARADKASPETSRARASQRARETRALTKWLSSHAGQTKPECLVKHFDPAPHLRGLSQTLAGESGRHPLCVGVLGQAGPERSEFATALLDEIRGAEHLVVDCHWSGASPLAWAQQLLGSLRTVEGPTAVAGVAQGVEASPSKAELTAQTAASALRRAERRLELASAERDAQLVRLNLANAKVSELAGAQQAERRASNVVHAFGDRQSAIEAAESVKAAWRVLGVPQRKMDALGLASGQEKIAQARNTLAEIERLSTGAGGLLRVLAHAPLRRERGFWLWLGGLLMIAGAAPVMAVTWPQWVVASTWTVLSAGLAWGLGGALRWASRQLQAAHGVFARVAQSTQEIERELIDAELADAEHAKAAREAQAKAVSEFERLTKLEQSARKLVHTSRRQLEATGASPVRERPQSAAAEGETGIDDVLRLLRERRGGSKSSMAPSVCPRRRRVVHLSGLDEMPESALAPALSLARRLADAGALHMVVEFDGSRRAVGPAQASLTSSLDLACETGRRDAALVRRSLAELVGVSQFVGAPGLPCVAGPLGSLEPSLELAATQHGTLGATHTGAAELEGAFGFTGHTCLPDLPALQTSETLSSEESLHLLDMAELLPTTAGAAEGFLRSYRHHRRCLDRFALARLVGDDQNAGHFPATQTLLALAYGDPELASTLADLLHGAEDLPVVSWGRFLTGLEATIGVPSHRLTELRRLEARSGRGLELQHFATAVDDLDRSWRYLLRPAVRDHEDGLVLA